MPPGTRTNNATKPNVAASLGVSNASEPTLPHRVGDDREHDERDHAPQQRAQRAVQEHRLRPLPVAEVRRVLDVHLVPVPASTN